MQLIEALDACPLVAILRGVTPAEVAGIAQVLHAAGFTIVEVPLNSPEPLESIARLAERFSGRLLVGAGTVTSVDAVRQVADAGGRLIVSPHFDVNVVRDALGRGLDVLPGAMSPSEIFAAVAAGAKAIKLFPAEVIQPQGVKALRSVLPKGVKLLPVGGIAPETIASYVAAGADGFGTGSALYKPGDDAATVATRARAFVEAASALMRRPSQG